MRLRSSQIVFLLLLVCSAQLRPDYALHLVTAAIAGRNSDDPQARRTSTQDRQAQAPGTPHALPVEALQLKPASAASLRSAWTVRHPARDAAATASYTSLRRG